MKRMVFLIVMMLFSSAGVFAASEGAHWDYDGQEGPEHWGTLAEKFDMCIKGENQSPIDLVADLDADLPELVFEYNG
jgi:carbonic anhydrase